MNALTITGNLVDEPAKVVYGDDNNMLANFRIGNNELVKGESVFNGFFDVTVFGPQAKNVIKSLNKGDRVVVSGRLQHSTYERDDGSKGGRTKLIAQVVGASLEFQRVRGPKKEKTKESETEEE